MTAMGRKVNLDRRFVRARDAAMSEERVKPANCRTMAEVRQGVDWLDEQIVALIAERFRYMDAAARIKPDRAAVRDEWRKADVIGKIAMAADREGAPVDRLSDLYEALVESSIAYEFTRFDQRRA